jgi:uncharacterized protein (TIGR03437 family)
MLAPGTAMDIEFVFGSQCYTVTCVSWADGSILALSSDPNLVNNSTRITVPVTVGHTANLLSFQLPTPVYYRNDTPNFDGTYSPRLTADPSLMVWVPIQTSAGNVWYFDSWGDGNRDNPRTFDASNGISGLVEAIMNFRTALPFGIAPGSLDLVALPGAAPPAQTVRLYPIPQTGKWTIGPPKSLWLTVSASAVNSSDGSVVVTGNADITGLAPGYYTTTFPARVAVNGLPDVSLDVPATLRIVGDTPAISASGIVSGASYQSGALSSREIITIFGKGLGPTQLVSAFVPQAGSLPTTLAGTSVEIQGQQAELLYVQDNAVAATVPETIYDTQTTVAVKLGGTTGASVTLPAPAPGMGTIVAPALFTSDSSGSGNLAAVNADGTVNSALNPAKRGSVVLLYGTGFYSPPLCGGKSFGYLFPASTRLVEAFVGGEPAYVLYSGSAAGMTCGAQQINIFIPEDSAIGPSVPVRLGMPFAPSGSLWDTRPYLWYSTPPGTTLAIQ